MSGCGGARVDRVEQHERGAVHDEPFATALAALRTHVNIKIESPGGSRASESMIMGSNFDPECPMVRLDD